MLMYSGITDLSIYTIGSLSAAPFLAALLCPLLCAAEMQLGLAATPAQANRR
jgi:hypothetical protein